jgi:hypothetical protein
VLRRLARALACAAFVAGCGGSVAPTATPAAVTQPSSLPATQATTPSPTASLVATPVASGPLALCAVGKKECFVSAGTYTTAPFEPAFTFSLDTTWKNTRAYEHGGGIGTQEGDLNWASGITAGFDGTASGANAEPPIGPTVEDFIAFLDAVESSDTLTRTGSGEVTIAGAKGRYVDFVRTENGAAVGFSVLEDTFILDRQAKARFIAVDVDGTTAVFVLEGQFAHTFDALLKRLQPVLDSIVWQ